MTNRSNIAIYLECIWCVREKIEPRMEVGFTTEGSLQLWCAVHDAAIGPPFELRYPPLVAHLTCHDCRNVEQRTHEHGQDQQDRPGENMSNEISNHDHGREHGHEKER